MPSTGRFRPVLLACLAVSLGLVGSVGGVGAGATPGVTAGVADSQATPTNATARHEDPREASSSGSTAIDESEW